MKLTKQEKQIANEAWRGCSVCQNFIYAPIEAVLAHRQPAQPEAQPNYEDVDMADANAAEQFAVCYVAKVGVSKETMIDAISTLQAIILRLRGRLVAQPEAQPAPDVVERLRAGIEFIQKIASGETQIAPDDTGGMEFIDRYCIDLLSLTAKPLQQETREQQVTAILQETVKETNEQWEAAAEKIAALKEGK